jgi:hypothetical protein
MIVSIRRSILFCALSILLECGSAVTQQSPVVLTRGNSTIVLEPYAPNIVRVTLSLQRESALAAPGYGVVAEPSAAGWSTSQTAQADVYSSPRMLVSVDRERATGPPPLHTMADIAKDFNGSTPNTHITIRTPDGRRLLELTGWAQDELNHKSGTASLEHDRRPSDPQFYTVSATFAAPADEHYYGLGQNQEGFLDHRGHPVHCWADYTAPAGTDWYNFWTSERVKGGQTITVASPIDTIPLFVRAGSIVPLGAPVGNTRQPQRIAQVSVYPGADASFTLFSDDGTTYAYEKGAGSITRFHWDDAKQLLTHDGAAGWSESDSSIVKIVGP